MKKLKRHIDFIKENFSEEEIVNINNKTNELLEKIKSSESLDEESKSKLNNTWLDSLYYLNKG